jgi:hypothetical protein
VENSKNIFVAGDAAKVKLNDELTIHNPHLYEAVS